MTTTDLYLTLSMISMVVLTVFAVITMYYLILILRRFHSMMDTLETLVDQLTDGLSEVYRKAEVLKNTVGIFSEGLQALLGMYQKRSERKRK